MPNSVCDVALLPAAQFRSGGRRYPLEIQAVAKSSQGATSRSYELCGLLLIADRRCRATAWQVPREPRPGEPMRP